MSWRGRLDKAATVALVLLLAGAAFGGFLWVAVDLLDMIENGRSGRGN